MDDIFEIRDGEIDTDEIISKIKANIERRKAQGAYTQEDEVKVNSYNIVQNEPSAVIDELSSLNNYWDIKYHYRISSHRKFIGPILVKGRRLVNGEVKRYVDPIFQRQKEFGLKLAHALSSVREQLYLKIDAEKTDILSSVDRKIEEASVRSNERLDEMDRLMESRLSEELDMKLDERLQAIADDIHKKAWLASVLDGRIRTPGSLSTAGKAAGNTSSMDYVSFSEEIGKSWAKASGEPQVIPNVFTDAIEIFESCNNVLDIGCGSGYFLQLLKARSIGAYGIDINGEYVAFCNKNGLSVINENAIDHLRSLNDDTLGGIFISQVVEHLSIEDIDELVKLCYVKMKSGASLVISTPNILSMLVSSNLFYMDPTHSNHVHPDVLRFILKSRGFREVEDRFYNQVPEDHKLKRVTVYDGAPQEHIAYIEAINSNVDMLNGILFGYRDYAAIAKKG